MDDIERQLPSSSCCYDPDKNSCKISVEPDNRWEPSMTICQPDEMMGDHGPQVPTSSPPPSSVHPPSWLDLITSAFPSRYCIIHSVTLLQRVFNIEKKEGNPIKNNRIALIFGREMLHNICVTGIPYDANYKVTANLVTPFDPGGHCLVSTKCWIWMTRHNSLLWPSHQLVTSVKTVGN